MTGPTDGENAEQPPGEGPGAEGQPPTEQPQGGGPPTEGPRTEGPHAGEHETEGPQIGDHGLLSWFAGRVVGRGGHTGALVAAGWATYNAVWLGVLSGFATTRGTAVGTTWPLYLYSGGVGLTFVFAGLITVSRWRHPVEPRQHSVSTRGDASLLGALGIIFGGLSVVFGSWWAPFSLVMFVMAIWLVVKDASARHRAPS